MDYTKMSDFEINRAVAIVQGFHPDECDIAKRGSASVGVEWNEETGLATKTFDYCNNPADAWPIIAENGIGIIPYKKGLAECWDASKGMLSGSTKDINPLRAAMIVFLIMQEI
ncbi:DUF2591 family protein [Kosakonia cowanii]|uniref:phage protein NinX family protein n=1 Tax=Kosakonia cowanii TaxID=208223 RepID=UPI002DDCAEF1|nr:phage protein NinX family protein [Kosakonia cowanii]WRY60952.1 DUF2591 family protein [Kosakonia cowanii]